MSQIYPLPKTVLMTTDTIGGVWTYALELIKQTQPYNVNYILATKGAPLNNNQREQVRKLYNVIVAESTFKLEWMEDPWKQVTIAGEWLLGLADRYKPDLIHLNDYSHGALKWNVPVVITAHSCVYSWFNSVHGFLPNSEWVEYKKRVTMGLNGADLVIAPSKFILNEIRRYYNYTGKSLVIYNGRDLLKFHPGLKEPFIFSAGRLWDEAKNIDAVSKAAEELSWPVYIAGDNKNPDTEHRYFNNVTWTGLLEESELTNWLQRSSIYAFPAKYEPFGLSVLEAALCGNTLVLGDIPSLHEIWGDSAFFIHPDDITGLKQVLQRLIINETEREHYSQLARRRALYFSSQVMAANYYSAYKSFFDKTFIEEKSLTRTLKKTGISKKEKRKGLVG